MPDNGHKLATYVADCLQLRADLDLLVLDTRLEQHPDRAVYYAVDHSVIELFVRPFREWAQVRLFADDEPQTLQAMSLLASERIFLSPDWKPILLPPYAVEFGRFLDWLGVGRLRDLANRFRLAIEELERLRENPEYRRMRDIVERHAAAGIALSPAEQHSIAEFVRKYIDVAAPIRLEQVAGPLARLSRLLGERRCISYEEVLDEQVEPDPAVVSRWYQQLTVERPSKAKHGENANLQDARAMGYLYALNRRLGPHRRLCLITASAVIHRLFEQEFREHWRPVTGHILRHPRQFTGFMHDAETYSGERGVRLRRMDATLYAFLTTVMGSREEVDRVFEASVHTRPKNLWRLLRNRYAQPDRVVEHQFQTEIKPLWRSSQHWSIYEQLLADDLEPDPGALGARELDQLFQLIERDEGLKERLAQEASRDLIQLERWHQQFVVGFQVKSAEPGEAVRARLDGQLSEDDISTMLGARLLHAPCVLHFYSEDVARILDVRGFEPLPSERWLKLFDAELTYERLLALAYAMAALNKWDIAENFGELARLAWHPGLGMGKQEALYLLAVCKRHGQRSPEMHMEAFDLLREADDERWRTVPETRPDPDPRFMRERAAQIFAWHVRRQRKLDQAEWRNSKPPPLDQAFEYSEQALALVGADKLLRAHLLNNLCFQHLSEGRLEQAQSYGKELRDILHGLEPNRREWPPAILDTIHQLRLAEGDGLTLDEIRDIEADYRAINLSTLEFDHREEITQRIAEIQELLATRRAHAPVG